MGDVDDDGYDECRDISGDSGDQYKCNDDDDGHCTDVGDHGDDGEDNADEYVDNDQFLRS